MGRRVVVGKGVSGGSVGKAFGFGCAGGKNCCLGLGYSKINNQID